MATYQSSHTGAEIDAAVDAVSDKADKATTLAGYGILDDSDGRYYALYGGTRLNVSLSSTNRIDLNDYKDTGSYYCTASADSAYIDNRPTSGNNAFRMWVSSTTGTSATYRRQRFQNFGSPDIYERTINDSSVWSTWQLVQSNLANYASASDVTTLQGYFTNGVANSATSATTLANTRTIWGQNFNGSGNVSGEMTGVGNVTTSGNIYMNNYKYIYMKDSGGTNREVMFLSTTNNFHIGFGTAGAGITTFINGNHIYFRTGTSRATAFVATSDGKVGIGTETPSALLEVAGNASITGTLTLGGNPVAVVYSGSTAPSSSTGSNGDIYIQTT